MCCLMCNFITLSYYYHYNYLYMRLSGVFYRVTEELDEDVPGILLHKLTEIEIIKLE